MTLVNRLMKREAKKIFHWKINKPFSILCHHDWENIVPGKMKSSLLGSHYCQSMYINIICDERLYTIGVVCLNLDAFALLLQSNLEGLYVVTQVGSSSLNTLSHSTLPLVYVLMVECIMKHTEGVNFPSSPLSLIKWRWKSFNWEINTENFLFVRKWFVEFSRDMRSGRYTQFRI